jgi:hypothetical protein
MYVLSYVQPPKDGAAFGKAVVLDPRKHTSHTAVQVSAVLREHNPHMTRSEADRYGLQIARKDLRVESVESSTGLRFRIDSEDRAPNVCPCCGRLVDFGDHVLAGSDDAYCLGCFTWKRGMTPCLPENTAHPESESES